MEIIGIQLYDWQWTPAGIEPVDYQVKSSLCSNCCCNIATMVINFLKTKAMVFHRPNPRNIIYPPVLDSIERVRVAKLLGVFVQSNF